MYPGNIDGFTNNRDTSGFCDNLFLLMPQRLDELERKVSYQDKLLQELNEVVFSLSKRLDQLESRQKTMKDQITNATLVKRQEDETPPPHY